jgi:transcriptional regulator with XRE-family HTH domain
LVVLLRVDKVLPIQCRMARAGLGLSTRKLAVAAKVSPQTVVRFERGEAIRKRTIDSLRQVLEAAGVEFTNGRKPGVRMSKR